MRFPSWGYYVGESDLCKGLGMGKAVEQRNPKGRAHWKDTQQVQFTGPDPSWMEGVRVRKETYIQPEPQDNVCALHQGIESRCARGADCEVRCWGSAGNARAAGHG